MECNWKSVWYLILQVLDEVLHQWPFEALIGEADWRFKLCQWTHRFDFEVIDEPLPHFPIKVQRARAKLRVNGGKDE